MNGVARRRVRILLVDDHRIVRVGLAGLLRIEPDLEVVGEAADGEAAIEQARRLQPDVICMDISMPRMNGIEATRIISRELPHVRIIGLSMHDAADMAHAMAEAGAVAYVQKDAPSDELLAVLRQRDGDGATG